jgi:hypothetical protein
LITSKIIELRSHIPKLEQVSRHIDVKQLLSSLLHNDVWFENDLDAFIMLLQKVDISKQLRTGYLENWGKDNQASELIEPWLSITTLLLYKLINDEKKSGVQSQQLAKRMNTLYKVLDTTTEPWLSAESSIRNSIESDFKKLFGKIPFDLNKIASHENTKPHLSNKKKTIPLTVLFWEGPIARAYLETIYSLGFTPEKIIHLVSGLDISTKKSVAPWLPLGIRKYYAANLQKVKINYWPNSINKNFPLLKKSIFDEVQASLGFEYSTLSGANELKDLSLYSDNVETMLVNGLRDPELRANFSKLSNTTMLFTGGGILPENILSIPKLRFIHIHPGFLPDIRGADCILWSIMLAGQPSATCFYMSSGIDTGNIIFPCWLPKVSFTTDNNKYDIKTLYQAVFSFFDPWVRSHALCHLLGKFSNFNTMPAIPQSLDSGTTYHFMHTSLQKYPLQLLFPQVLD